MQATALPELLQAFFVRNSEFPTTLFAATCQQFTAVFGTHTLAETMFVFAGAAGRLECTFHRVIKKLAAFQKSERKGKTIFLFGKRFLGKSLEVRRFRVRRFGGLEVWRFGGSEVVFHTE